MEKRMEKCHTSGEPMNVTNKCLMLWEKDSEMITKESDMQTNFDGKMQQFRRNNEFSEETHQAVQNQNDIGWHDPLKGRASEHWK